jgi:hypothetical protein
MDNVLPEGTSRIGQVFDGIEDTPHIAAQLSRDADGVRLELSLLAGFTDFHEAWFKDQQVPAFLQFRDVAGAVALAGCRFGGYNRSFGYRQGKGIVWAEQAVIGGEVYDYSAVDAVRSDIAGMSKWSGLSSVTRDHEHTEESRLKASTIHAESQPALTIGGTPSVLLSPYFSVATDDANGTTSIQEQILVETRTTTPASWDEHLRPHGALQDLLALAYWWPCRLEVTTAQRLDDPYRSQDGGNHGSRWLETVVRRTGRRSPGGDRVLPTNTRPLFVFADIGVAGVARWLAEYETLGRPVWPLAALLYQGNTPVEAELLQVGTALEALGYQLAGDQTLHYVDYLKLVAGQVAGGIDVVRGAQPDLDTWATTFNKAYKGVKHADNQPTSPVVAYEMTRAGSMLARLWLGVHLGADPAVLVDRARYLM